MLRHTFVSLESIPRALGFALTLIGVWPSIVEGQSLSFLKTLPAGPPPWSAAAVAGDASGIYIAESDTYLRKYDRDGMEIWSRRLDAQIRSMATHEAGVYVGGLTQNNTVPGPQGLASVESLIRLYDAQGNEQWTRQFGFTGGTFPVSYVHAVAADASGVYAAGSFSTGTYLRKYDTGGTELWTKRFENGATYFPLIVAAGPGGIYFGENDDKTPFLRKYDASGTEIWTHQLDGDYVTAITATDTGVYVTGFGASGVFLSRYDSNGNQIWIRERIGGWIQRIAGDTDTDGIYAAGVTSSALPGQCAAGSSDAFVKWFDADGSELWTRQFGTYRYEDVAGIVVDTSNIFVAGSQSLGAIMFPAGSLDHAFLAKLEKATFAASASETRIRNECVVNAASNVGGAVSPGEIVRILGTAIGPSAPVSARSVEGRPFDTTLAETRVLFGGVAAPLLEVSSGQITMIAPYAVAGQSSVEVQVEYRGVRSNAVTLPVLQSHPGVFSLDSAGWGAARNEDGTVNSPENPARRGSTVSIYGTGGGETDPATADGQVVGNSPPKLKTSVLVSFPGTECTGYDVPAAEATYSGAVAGFVAGLVQVNVRVPESLPDGNWLLELRFGGRSEAETQSLQIAVR